MTDFSALQREDRRLCILRYLAEDSDYSLNDSILDKALAGIGHAVSRDSLRTDIAWLREQGLVSTQEVMDGKVWVVTLDGRGLDVATGRTVVPGIARPRPGT